MYSEAWRKKVGKTRTIAEIKQHGLCRNWRRVENAIQKIANRRFFMWFGTWNIDVIQHKLSTVTGRKRSDRYRMREAICCCLLLIVLHSIKKPMASWAIGLITTSLLISDYPSTLEVFRGRVAWLRCILSSICPEQVILLTTCSSSVFGWHIITVILVFRVRIRNPLYNIPFTN